MLLKDESLSALIKGSLTYEDSATPATVDKQSYGKMEVSSKRFSDLGKLENREILMTILQNVLDSDLYSDLENLDPFSNHAKFLANAMGESSNIYYHMHIIPICVTLTCSTTRFGKPCTEGVQLLLAAPTERNPQSPGTCVYWVDPSFPKARHSIME